MSTAPLLVVEHEALCPSGWMGEWLVEAGVDLDQRRPYRGEPLPGDLRAHSGLLVLGGSMGARDDAAHPWLSTTKDLVREGAAQRVPVLGICLGHQLAAVALGGDVVVNPAGQQLGVLSVGWTAEAPGDALLGPLAGPARAVQWNNDVVTTLPPGAVALARAATGELQAARFAPTVWGVQWHPEAGADTIRVWADADRDHAVERGIDVDAYLADVAAAEDEQRVTWRALAECFAWLLGRVGAA